MQGIDRLAEADIDDAEFDATQLLLKLFDGDRNSFLINRNEVVSDDTVKQYLLYIDQRTSHTPLQYILGEWDFYESTFHVGEGVLIPRSETEELVDICVDLIKKNRYSVVYDLCSGSGCIGLSIAKKLPEIKCYLFELYDTPLEFISQNKQLLSVDNVEIIKCDVLNPRFTNIPFADLIVSNPPYIESDDISSLQQEVKREPLTALDGGKDGLVFYRAIAADWLKYLSDGGSVALECGEDQPLVIQSFFENFNFKNTKYDMYGTERFVIAENYTKGDLQ